MMQDYLDIIDMNVIWPSAAVAEVHIDYTEILPGALCRCFRELRVGRKFKKTYAWIMLEM
jgi:hypothetical protein